jgi:hydrogenase maturation protease
MMTEPRILIACIGNIFHGDDAFGVEVAKQLAGRRFPENVRVVDFGIRSFDLTFALMDDFDVTVFVDATQRGGAPGTLYLIEADLSEIDEFEAEADAHGMNPMKVLAMAKAMGAEFKRLLVIGCEPQTLGGEEGLMGLSEPVQAVIAEAVEMIESLVADIRAETRSVITV